MTRLKEDNLTSPLPSCTKKQSRGCLRLRRVAYSVRKRSEFDSLYASPSLVSARSGPFRALWRSPAVGQSDRPRLGMVVPKKFTKSVVRRNLVKRLIRCHFRDSFFHLPASDIVISLKESVRFMLKSEIRQHLFSLFASILRKRDD